ncbi:hypothetical protein LWC35_14515 [Pseudonocardia kujensis]|uniref:hypothetical protein n=1 Tax=Pseudonocardia kujensis TaxID=1128675 RepID=UPI001E3D71FB|nr:hypothetical protein [Pseudonocardia kujensis]MCE0764114.1 hypothetical protein [Pseudonocardia kujensis]
MTSSNDQKFSLTVKRGVMVPDLDAFREFVKQLQDEFKNAPELLESFSDNPAGFLGERGVNADLQREFVTELGIGGHEFGCSVLSCVATDGCVITEVTLPPIIP